MRLGTVGCDTREGLVTDLHPEDGMFWNCFLEPGRFGPGFGPGCGAGKGCEWGAPERAALRETKRRNQLGVR